MKELRGLVTWSEGIVWVTPERHGAMTGIMKAQVDWMRMVTIPNQSSVPKAFAEFNEQGRMRLSPLYLRVVDVCEELVKFTWMMRGRSQYLTSRYSERVETAEEVSRRVNQS